MKKASHLSWFVVVLLCMAMAFPPTLLAQAQSAGIISRQIPNVNLQHGARVQLASANAKVLWGDVVTTDRGGRARIALDDGSILNVGSDSSLRVVEHDAATQRTRLQLSYGRLRASAVRLARANSSFEVRTPTAVAGVVGTDFGIEYSNDMTNVHVYEGSVKFCNRSDPWEANHPYALNSTIQDPNGNLHKVVAAGTSGSSAPNWNARSNGTTPDSGTLAWQNVGPVSCVTVLAGFTAAIRGSQPPSSPVPTPPTTATASVQSTTVGGGAGGGGAGAAVGAGTAAGVSHSVLILATVIAAVAVPAIAVPVAAGSQPKKCGCTTAVP